MLQEVLRAIRLEPLLSTYHAQSDQELLGRFQDVTRNFTDWLEAGDDHRLQTRYRELAQERMEQQVPLSQVVLAAQTFERVLIEELKSRSLDGLISADSDVEALVRRFFNRIVLSIVVTYERALFRAILS